MNKVIWLGIGINLLSSILLVLGVLQIPPNWPLIILAMITGIPGGFVILKGIWSL